MAPCGSFVIISDVYIKMNVVLVMLQCSAFVANSSGLSHLLYTDEAASNERIEEIESDLKLMNYDVQLLYHTQNQRFDGIESNIELLYTHSCACMLFILLFAWMQCFINCMHTKATDHVVDAVVIKTPNDETFKKP